MMNFLNETNNLTTTETTETTETPINLKPIILKFGTEEVEVLENLNDANETLLTLVKRYEEELGIDASRITSFRTSGQVISASDIATPGTIYSLGISAESKG